MSLIQIENLTKSFFGKVLFNQLNLQINEGEKLAILGENGAGKTTLCRILTGQEQADGGKVTIAHSTSISYLSQHLEKQNETLLAWQTEAWLLAEEKLKQTLLHLENLEGKDEIAQQEALKDYEQALLSFEQLGGYDYKNHLAQILSKLSLSPDILERRLSTCSGGEQMRIALAKVLLSNPKMLILDEPTNHLDLTAIDWLVDYLKKFKGTLVLISHDRYFLNQLAERCLFIEKNLARSFVGNYDQALALKKAEEALLDQKMEVLEKEIEHQLKVKQTFLSHRNISGYHQREKWVHKLQNELQEMKEKRAQAQHRMQFRFVPEALDGDTQKSILELKNIQQSFEEKKVLQDLELRLRMKDKMILLGPNGSGKTTLMRIISGQLPFDSGEVRLQQNLSYAYMSQIIHFEEEEASCLETLTEFLEESEGVLKGKLALFGFRVQDVYKQVSVLSGGERARLYLCCLLAAKPQLLLLDEPTNHLDLYSREILEEAIKNYQGAVIAVSHDRYFIESFAQRFCLMKEGKIQEFDQLAYALKAMEAQQEALWRAKKSLSDEEKFEKQAEKEKRQEQQALQKQEKLNATQQRKQKQQRLREQKKTEEALELLKQEHQALLEKISSSHLAEDYQRLAELEAEMQLKEEALLELWLLLEESED